MNPAAFVRKLTEADPATYIPYAGHVTPEIVLTMQNSLVAIIKMHGLPFELFPMKTRIGRVDRINTLLMQLSNPDLTLHWHFCHYTGAIKPAPQLQPTNPFVRDLMRSYKEIVLNPNGLFTNSWFVSVILRQPKPPVRQWREYPRRAWSNIKRERVLGLNESRHKKIEDIVAAIMKTFDEYQPVRLGLTEIPHEDGSTVPVTEIGTTLRLFRTGHYAPMPHTAGPLAAALYADPTDFAEDHFKANIPGVKRVGAMLSLQTYPIGPRVGMFNALMSAPYPLVFNQSFRYRATHIAISAMNLINTQMTNAGDPAKDLKKEVEEAANQVSSMQRIDGYHQFGVAVYGKDEAALDENVADATTRIAGSGAVPTRERNRVLDGALATSYFLQQPGCSAFQPRPAKVSSFDLAKMVSLDNFPEGETEGYWGPAILRFKTNGNTILDYISHDEDVGHFRGYGANGRGKTALNGMILSAFEPIMGKNGIRVQIDKDQSNRLCIEAGGGIYNTLRRNVPSGLAPLVAYPNTPRSRSFFHQTYRYLIHKDKRPQITQDEDDRLMRGIARQLEMPPHLRTMWGVREFLGFADRDNGAGARFERYCEGGSMGWLLANKEHVVDVGAGFYGFDFTELLPKEGQEDDGACQIAASVISHQLSGLMDGRKIVFSCDESRFYMESLMSLFDDFSLTGRKKELILGLWAQQPEHHSDSPIGMSLISQMRTAFYFPDTSYDVPTLTEKHKLSQAAARKLTTEMTMGNMRRFLLWRPPNKSAICEFDLSGLPQLPLLSGRPGTIELMDRIRETAESPEDAIDEFCRRVNSKGRITA